MSTDQGRSSLIITAALPAAGMPVSGPINGDGLYITRNDNTTAAQLAIVQSRGIQDPVTYPFGIVGTGTAGEPDLATVCRGMTILSNRSIITSTPVDSTNLVNFYEWSYARGQTCTLNGNLFFEMVINAPDDFPPTITYRIFLPIAIRQSLAGALGSDIDLTSVAGTTGSARFVVVNNNAGTMRYQSWIDLAPGVADAVDIIFDFHDRAPYDGGLFRQYDSSIFYHLEFDIIP